MSQAETLKILQNDPERFRLSLVVDADSGPIQLGSIIDDWQADDFRALDDAWKRVVGRDVQPKFSRAWLERPRGHSKTSDLAIQLCWALFASPPRRC